MKFKQIDNQNTILKQIYTFSGIALATGLWDLATKLCHYMETAVSKSYRKVVKIVCKKITTFFKRRVSIIL